MNCKETWDAVYKNRTPDQLPWYGIPFLDHINPYLRSLEKTDLLIVTGCGVGDTADKLYREGFSNILATDISSEAIITAQKRFPHIRFRCFGTEELSKKGYKDANVIDWLNLHQINPELVSAYVSSLNKISKSLFLAYFHNPEEPSSRKSAVTGALVYNYNPLFIDKMLPNLEKKEEFIFYVSPNKVVGRLADKLRAEAHIYRK